MPALRNCSATTSSARSARSSLASTCPRPCRRIGQCDVTFAVKPAVHIWVPAFAGTTARCAATLRLLQRGGEILDQIVGMLEPRGEAHKALADAELGAGFGAEPLVGGGGGMGDQALGVAEIVGDVRKLELVEETEGAGLAALDLETDQRRARTHLLLHDSRLRMILAPRIDQPRNLRMFRQRIRNPRRIL